MKTLSVSGIGPEILKAISERSKQAALDYNIKQAQKYLNYAIKTGDSALIEYAKKKLNEQINKQQLK